MRHYFWLYPVVLIFVLLAYVLPMFEPLLHFLFNIKTTHINVIQVLFLSLGICCILFRKKIHKKRREILLLCSVILGFFILAEIGVQIYGNINNLPYYASSSPMMYEKHHYLNYMPARDYVSADGKNRHNSLGFRGEEIMQPKPPGIYRIVALGGSTTYTTGVPNYAFSYPTLLQQNLRDLGYHNIEVINAGVAGYTTWESLINFEFRVLDLNPDAIIVYHSVNDVRARLVAPSSYKGDNSGSRKQWQEPAGSFLLKSSFFRLLYLKLTGKSALPVIGWYTTPMSWSPMNRKTTFRTELNTSVDQAFVMNAPIYFERNLKNIIAIAGQHDIAVILSTWAYSDEFDLPQLIPVYTAEYQKHNQIIRTVAANEKVFLYDFAQQMPLAVEYWIDGRHVNKKGAQKKAQLFAHYIDTLGLVNKSEAKSFSIKLTSFVS